MPLLVSHMLCHEAVIVPQMQHLEPVLAVKPTAGVIMLAWLAANSVHPRGCCPCKGPLHGAR